MVSVLFSFVWAITHSFFSLLSPRVFSLTFSETWNCLTIKTKMETVLCFISLILSIERHCVFIFFLMSNTLYHLFHPLWTRASLVAQSLKNTPAVQETWVQSLGWENTLRRKWQPTPVSLAWKSLWTVEPGGLQFMGSQRVRHDWATNTYLLTYELGGKFKATNSNNIPFL